MRKPRPVHKYKEVDQVKQFRDWMKNTLRRAFFRYWERTKAIQAARVDRGLYRCAKCLNVSKMKGHHIDHIEPVVDPKVGFVNWDVFISRLFCSASNLQLLCKICHTGKTREEQQERKKYKTGIYALGKTHPEEVKKKISLAHKQNPMDETRLKNLQKIQMDRRKPVTGTNLITGEQVEFESIAEAAKVVGGSTGTIHMVIVGRRNHTKGWKFKYKEGDKECKTIV